MNKKDPCECSRGSFYEKVRADINRTLFLSEKFFKKIFKLHDLYENLGLQ